MWSIFRKEIHGFFSSLTGYLVIAVFLSVLGLMMWVFPDYSILDFNYASLEQLFIVAPVVFLFLIPAVCMRSFSEEKQSGTLELLLTRPLTLWHIIMGKYFGALVLVFLALLPTLLYYYSIVQLGAPPGNIDRGEVIGSYIGLLFLCGIFISVSLFASALSFNQVVAFILSVLLCFVTYWGFHFISSLPSFYGGVDQFFQKLGIRYHYESISRGAIDSRDIVYFLSAILLFLFSTDYYLRRNRNR